MILLAKELVNDETKHLSTMNISVKRNAYGRQLKHTNILKELMKK